MKKYLAMLSFAVITILFVSCKKDIPKVATSYTMHVVNAAVNVSGIQINPAGNNKINYSSTPQVAFGARGIYYVQSDQPLTIVAATDTSTFLVNKTFGFANGVYTLFVVGQSPTIDTLVKAETDIPFIPNVKLYTNADSMVNLRFANFSPNSVPLKIKIASSSTNEVDNLPYKSISPWRSYKATATTTTYSLQIRDAATDALITTYTFTANATNRFKNVMLIVKGLQGTSTGNNAFGISVINYF